jgi:protein-S-isoprenylcysteine O-methyltransferase Ste14
MNNTTEWNPTVKERMIFYFTAFLGLGQIILCVLFYNSAGRSLLLYIGWILFASGIFVTFLAGYAFRKEGKVPEGRSIVHTTVIVDTGLYGIIRHPQYLSFILIVLSFMLIAQRWLSVIFGTPLVIYLYDSMRQEEKSNIRKFGNAYERYMSRVPRMNILAGFIRRLRRKK